VTFSTPPSAIGEPLCPLATHLGFINPESHSSSRTPPGRRRLPKCSYNPQIPHMTQITISSRGSSWPAQSVNSADHLLWNSAQGEFTGERFLTYRL
jgi:hypothetical protein